MVELEPTAYSYYKLARAELGAGNPRAAYAAALRSVFAARRERSFNGLFGASHVAATCVQCEALGPKWRCSQVAPFLDNMEEALPHLRRWMPPAMLERWIKDCVAPLRECRRLHAHSDR